MTVLALLAALSVALCVGSVLGYVVGHRRGARTPTWKQRTSRAYLGREAAGLVALLTVSRLQRAARRRLPRAVRR
ncbi:hypothetical protein FHR72_004685 [Mycolicibacterium iranicum]|uniref:Uncharacterized protein n=1 Tax=Mycolicibacterium iranicum TaxID=912594 RepID=A0A839QAK8_MYCIR|nr:hypothetical protein [Mycolicibacterium iranicum]MBB2993178.1 hypothetical protein [Mycolicibacterium iranicum]